MTNPTPRIQKQQPASSMLCRNGHKHIQANNRFPIVFKKEDYMNIQKFNTEKKNYISPSIKMIDLQVSSLICVSGDGTEQYLRNEDPDIF